MNPTKVLIVEDDTTLRNLVAVLLERAGCEVVMASDGAEALRMIATEMIDFVLLDLAMPRVSGADVLREVAASKSELLPRIVVMTAALDGDAQQALGGTAVRGMLRKPFNNDELIAAIA